MHDKRQYLYHTGGRTPAEKKDIRARLLDLHVLFYHLAPFFNLFLIVTFTFHPNAWEVLPSAFFFWESCGHRYRPFSPPVRAFIFCRAYGSAFLLLVDFRRM